MAYNPFFFNQRRNLTRLKSFYSPCDIHLGLHQCFII